MVFVVVANSIASMVYAKSKDSFKYFNDVWNKHHFITLKYTQRDDYKVGKALHFYLPTSHFQLTL